MSLFITPILFLLVALGLLALVLWQPVLARRRLGTTDAALVPPADLVQRQLDQLYAGFAFFFKQAAHHLYFYWLLVMQRVVVVSRMLLVLIEKKFSRLIDSVRGKGLVGKRGAVSLFLADISRK